MKRSSQDLELPLLKDGVSVTERPTRIKHQSHFLEYLSEFSNPVKYLTKYTAFEYVSFGDLWHYIKKINLSKEPITIPELPLPYDYFNIESKIVQLDQKWLDQKNNSDNPSFAKALYHSFKTEFYKCGVIMFLIFLGRLFTTLVLGKLIYLISKGTLVQEMELGELVLQGIYFAIIFLVTNITNTHYWNYTYLIGCRVRLATVGLVYKKLQSTALSSLQEINIGTVINLLANDLNDLDFGFAFAWPFILTPVTLGLSAYVMWDYFSYFTLVSIAYLVLSLVASNKISEMTKDPRIEKNAITDERVKLTNEIIECIRLIKMYAWDKAFRKAIETLREREFFSYLRLFRLQAFGRAVTEMASYMAAYFMFVLYVLAGDVLTPEKVYATLMILGFVRMWCIAFPYWGRNFMVGARVLQGRVERILNIKDVMTVEEATVKTEKKSLAQHKASLEILSPSLPGNKDIAPIFFREYSAYWSANSQKPCLSDLNLTIRPGEVTAVIGKIGSGKTSFLLSLLREVPKTRGSLSSKGSIAYVEQEPIIFSGSVRENILFGKAFDDHLYHKVVRACNLQSDFTQLSDGDKTIVGEKGVTLSGGQKARVSLARALYSRSDIYLLDDPLSAVDSKVARHLFNYAIKGDLLKDKIVVLVTHHISFAKEADRILVFDEGKVIAEGSYQELSTQQLDLLNIFKKEHKQEDEQEVRLRKNTSIRKTSIREDGSIVEEEVPVQDEADKKQFKEEEPAVTFATYKNYLKASGKWGFFIVMVLSFVVFQLSLIGYARFMGNWALKHQAHSLEYGTAEGFEHWPYIVGGFFITLTFFATNYAKSYLCAKFFAECNTNIHQIMLRKTTRALISFFDNTPIGVILNKFSNDLGLLDKTNWETVHNVLWGICMLFFAIGTVCLINPYVLIPSAIIFWGLVKIRNFFAKASVETKRLDLMSRSPLYSEISATLNGLLIIRVFRQGGRFVQTFMDILYKNSRCLLFMQRTQGVFGMVVDLWLYVLTVSGIFLYIYLAFTTSLDPSLFGLAMVLLLDLCNGSSFVVKQTLQLDVNMQSAERVLKYCKLEEEAPEARDKDDEVRQRFQGRWPDKGHIVLSNVSMKYGADLNVYALKDLNFEIPAGTKIGVIGRTGAGKSSIIQALFRMTEIERKPGSEILIDGVNIGQLGVDILRRSLSIIPQTAVIFTGTIRRNLDPFGDFSNFEIWQVLEEVKLRTYVESLDKQLDTDMTVSHNVFSAGQKQLICLARAILRKSKIIILDEATANVDVETDNFIQEKINEKFKGCTVITVAHRLTTIAHYDRILVLEKGSVVEYDTPYRLLVEKEGDKQMTNPEGWFAKMVQNTGDSMAKRIFEITYDKYRADLKVGGSE